MPELRGIQERDEGGPWKGHRSGVRIALRRRCRHRCPQENPFPCRGLPGAAAKQGEARMGAGLNLYEAFGGDPINRRDLLGLSSSGDDPDLQKHGVSLSSIGVRYLGGGAYGETITVRVSQSDLSASPDYWRFWSIREENPYDNDGGGGDAQDSADSEQRNPRCDDIEARMAVVRNLLARNINTIDLELQQLESLGGRTSGLLDRLADAVSVSGIGATTIVVGDTLWSMSTGKPIMYGYGPISSEGVRGSVLTGTAGQVIRAGGVVLSAAGGAIDSVNTYSAFSNGDIGGTIRYGASTVGSFAGIFFWPAAVGTAMGNGSAMGIEYYGRKRDEASTRRSLNEALHRRIAAEVSGQQSLQNLKDQWEEYGCNE